MKIDLGALAMSADRSTALWFNTGWNVLVDDYRQFQDAISRNGIDDCLDNETAAAAYTAAGELLAHQVAAACGTSAEDAAEVLLAKLRQTCGTPEDPKGLDAWRNR